MPEEDVHAHCLNVHDMRTGAIAANEMFLSLKEAGFNDDQAFDLTKVFIAGSMS